MALVSIVGCSGRSASIMGSVGKGKAIAGSVSAYTSAGTLIGTDTTIEDGRYFISNSSNYTGKVKVEANITAYHDEMLNKDVKVSGLQMIAVSSVSATDNTVNITPLTEVAAKILASKTLSSMTSKEIADMNKNVAKMSGIQDDYNPAKSDVIYINKGAGAKDDTAENRNGIVLLAVSKDSNLSFENNATSVGIKATMAIDNLYTAIVKAPKDKTAIEAIVEDLGDTGVSIKGVKDTDIIPNPVAHSTDAKADTAMTKIAAYADDNTKPKPTVQDYADAGVTGVNAANLNAVNAGVDATNAAGVDTVAEIQAIVDANTKADTAMTKIAAYADDNTKPEPTVQDYADAGAGVTGVNADNLNAVNARVDATNAAGVDTVAEIQAIVNAGANVTKSTVTVGSSSVIADNTSTTLITLQAKNSAGTDMTTGGETVAFDQNGSATISSVTDVGTGLYTATIKSATPQTVEINATIGGVAVTTTMSTVTFTEDANVNKSTVDVNQTTVGADGTSKATITLQAKNSANANITTGGETVAFDQNGSATISSVTDNNNGTYTATITNTTIQTVEINATIGGVAVTDTASIAFKFPANITINDANITSVIVSIADIQGDINMTATPNGKAISIPYTVTGSATTLPAYSKTFTIASHSTQDNESDIVATFAWTKQTNLAVGTGTFIAHITIDDSAGDSDKVYKAKN